MRVAYLVNHYPAISHSFIRREILALEEVGVEVERFALRGWDGELVDPAGSGRTGKDPSHAERRDAAPLALPLCAVCGIGRRGSGGR